jgi:hypothetical protein
MRSQVLSRFCERALEDIRILLKCTLTEFRSLFQFSHRAEIKFSTMADDEMYERCGLFQLLGKFTESTQKV